MELYSPELGVVNITTRENIQLQGLKLEGFSAILNSQQAQNQTWFQSALHNNTCKMARRDLMLF